MAWNCLFSTFLFLALGFCYAAAISNCFWRPIYPDRVQLLHFTAERLFCDYVWQVALSLFLAVLSWQFRKRGCEGRCA
jgi:hypothetical protein